MISIPDHLVSLFKQSQQQPAIEEKDASELSEIERGPLSYIAGYVLSQLRKKSSNDELQLLIQTMMCPSSENTYRKLLNLSTIQTITLLNVITLYSLALFPPLILYRPHNILALVIIL